LGAICWAQFRSSPDPPGEEIDNAPDQLIWSPHSERGKVLRAPRIFLFVKFIACCFFAPLYYFG
jgi:hypothetical protein